MKTSTIKKVVKKSRAKKSYSLSQIREAIAYWKGRLASLNEAEGEEHGGGDEAGGDDVDGKNLGFADEDSAESKAEGKPVGGFNPMKRFYRMHLHAKDVVGKKLGALLSKSKCGTPQSVEITNSAIDDDNGTCDFDTDKVTVTVKVTVDQAQVKGFRKFIAVLKEEDIRNPENIDEGLLSALLKGVADTAKGVSKAAKEKIDDANEKLKVKIGVSAMQEYFKAVFGNILAKKVNTNNVFCGVDDSGNEAVFVYCASVAIKQ